MGRCTISDSLTPICTCDEEFFVGDLCEIGVVRVQGLPFLKVNEKSEAIVLKASPNAEVVINVTVTPDSIKPDNILTIHNSKQSVSFFLLPYIEGVYKIQYQIISEQFIPPDDSIAVATVPGSSSDYHLSGGLLEHGCCRSRIDLDNNYCPLHRVQTSLSLSSTCQWQQGEIKEAKGIVFIHTNSLDLPLSIVGLKINVHNMEMDFIPGDTTCNVCNSDELDCRMDHPDVSAIMDMLTKQSLLQSFLVHISSIIPSNIDIKVFNPDSISKQSYSKHEYMASILKSDDLKDIESCSKVNSAPGGLYYVLQSTSDFDVTVNNETVEYIGHDFFPLCFVYSLCHDYYLEIGLPRLVSQSILEYSGFHMWLDEDWLFNFDTVLLAESGIRGSERMTYWDGRQQVHVGATVATIGFTMSSSGGLRSREGNVNITASFKGNVFIRDIERISHYITCTVSFI